MLNTLQQKGHKFMVIVLALLTLPIVLVIRALRPFVLIRFGKLAGDRIGHFAANTEVYLCERDAGLHSRRTLDIFYFVKPICNNQLKKMWRRTLHVFRITSFLYKANNWLPGGEKHVVPRRQYGDRDIHGLLPQTQPHLFFTAEEEKKGQKALLQLGIPESVPFICFYSRESAYLDTVLPHNKWRYHDFRDANIHNYLPAGEELTRRGYYALRMGAVVKEDLEISNPMIIDYAKICRSDFLDIFLCAKCHFFLGHDSGISAIPMIFRTPTVWANYIPLELAPTWSPDDLFILKKLWLKKEQRFLTFREILDSGIGRLNNSEKYEKQGIEVIENTPEEITAVAIEMDERLKGNWKTTEEDEELQRRFWALFKPSELNQVFITRIGTKFLHQNRELLE